jgi:hypothetical protein
MDEYISDRSKIQAHIFDRYVHTQIGWRRKKEKGIVSQISGMGYDRLNLGLEKRKMRGILVLSRKLEIKRTLAHFHNEIIDVHWGKDNLSMGSNKTRAPALTCVRSL